MPQISFSAIPDLPPLCLEHRPRKQAPDYQALSFINPRRQIGYYSAGAVVLKDSFAQLYPVLAKAVFWHYVPERQAMVLVPKELHLSTDELQSLLRDQGTRGVLAAALRALKTASTEESNLPQSQSQAQSQSQSQPKPQPLSVLFVEANGITLQSLQEATPIKSPVVAEVSEYASVDAQSLPESERAMHEHFMDLALEQARLAGEQGEVPVGAVIVNELNEILAVGANSTITNHDATAHAEVVAIRAAGLVTQNYRLTGLRLYVTLEPCCMCTMAAIHARIGTVIYGAADPRTGACGSVFTLSSDKRHNHRLKLISNVRQQECAELLREFFRARRN